MTETAKPLDEQVGDLIEELAELNRVNRQLAADVQAAEDECDILRRDLDLAERQLADLSGRARVAAPLRAALHMMHEQHHDGPFKTCVTEPCRDLDMGDRPLGPAPLTMLGVAS